MPKIQDKYKEYNYNGVVKTLAEWAKLFNISLKELCEKTEIQTLAVALDIMNNKESLDNILKKYKNKKDKKDLLIERLYISNENTNLVTREVLRKRYDNKHFDNKKIFMPMMPNEKRSLNSKDCKSYTLKDINYLGKTWTGIELSEYFNLMYHSDNVDDWINAQIVYDRLHKNYNIPYVDSQITKLLKEPFKKNMGSIAVGYDPQGKITDKSKVKQVIIRDIYISFIKRNVDKKDYHKLINESSFKLNLVDKKHKTNGLVITDKDIQKIIFK